MMVVLKNNEEIRLKTLNDPIYLLSFAREGKWGYVHGILLMFRDMLDHNFPAPAPSFTAFTDKFREPIIFLLKESIKNPASGVFYDAFA